MWEQAHGLQRPVRAARYPGIPFSPESPGFSGNRSCRPSVTFFIVFLSFSPKRILKTGEPDLSCFHENEFGINVKSMTGAVCFMLHEKTTGQDDKKRKTGTDPVFVKQGG